MPTANSIIERVLSKIDQDELVQLVMALTKLDSPTGREQSIADFVFNWFAENGFSSIRQEVEKERYNAVGILRGAGGSPSLTLNGHLDIVVTTQPVGSVYTSDGDGFMVMK